MKTITTVTSLAALIAMGALTACSEQSQDDAAETAQEVVTVVEEEVVEPAAEQVSEMTDAAEDMMAEDSDLKDKAFIALTETEIVTAAVTAIDHETREVTLAGENGEMTFVAGDEVQNLDQVQVGDQIVAEYLNQLTLEVIDGEGMEAGEGLVEIAERAEQGELPGMVAGASEVRVFMIEAIDLEDSTFKLRNVDGEVRQFTARNPENLKLADVGDALVATMTTMVAVEVTHAE
ncbi:hypothetical protein [Gilvimarinus sp. DA14]|uniref:hypothetical protein n=1 Tax=Gilvimarinus sp. DA14 TaxID=2956798 RepID=UPI0020B85103|nr:hypothetical protein [Gilvimarinus sp. DA14]UTF59925.1 hypothetical protein NHM04_15845 [Gilvimarinus sp. DA14]